MIDGQPVVFAMSPPLCCWMPAWPEPVTMSLLGVGAAMVLRRRRSG